jgi:hypothetical protein
MRWITVFAVALMIVAAASFGQSASAAVSKLALPHSTTLVSKLQGTIGHAPPSANARALVRAAGLDDGSGGGSENELGSDDGAGFGGKVAHGTIGGALPSAGAASRIQALGLDD